MNIEERIKELENLPDYKVINRWLDVCALLREKFTDVRKRLIAVEGNIGSGKTTFVRFLSILLGAKPYYEDVDKNDAWHGVIEQFYRDRIKFGFSTQIALLHIRRDQAERAYKLPKSAILDRTYWADRKVFVPTLVEDGLTESEVGTLEVEYEKFRDQFPPLDLMIILQCSPETCHRRLVNRGRDLEKGTDLTTEKLDEKHYLVKINRRYRLFARELRNTELYRGPVIEIDYDNFRLKDDLHKTALFEEIRDALKVDRDRC